MPGTTLVLVKDHVDMLAYWGASLWKMQQVKGTHRPHLMSIPCKQFLSASSFLPYDMSLHWLPMGCPLGLVGCLVGFLHLICRKRVLPAGSRQAPTKVHQHGANAHPVPSTGCLGWLLS